MALRQSARRSQIAHGRQCSQVARNELAALHARVSTDRQQQERTIASQALELKKQIARSSDVLVKEYIDDGYSGTILDRPALEALRKDASSTQCISTPPTVSPARSPIKTSSSMNC
jgi:hypothetical protein